LKLTLFAKYNENVQVKEDKMGRAHGKEEECMEDFGGKA
jgi:hypothetical protein